MNDNDVSLVHSVSYFYDSLLKKEKGLKSKIIAKLYAQDCNYIYQPYKKIKEGLFPSFSFPEDTLFDNWYAMAKSLVGWEVYILFIHNGTLEGFQTGEINNKVIGGKMKYGQNFEIDKKSHYIHIILPDNFKYLMSQCDISYPGLKSLQSLSDEFPVCYTLRDFYLSYLRASYQATTFTDSESVVSQFKKEISVLENHLPPDCDKDTLKDFYSALEARIEEVFSERRASLYEIKEGKILVYDGKTKKDARLINSWLYPDESEGLVKERDNGEDDRIAGQEIDDPYERFRQNASFEERIDYLKKTIRQLLGRDYDEEYINLLAGFRLGKVQSVLDAARQVTGINDLSLHINMLSSYLALLTRANTYLLKCKNYPRVPLNFGYPSDKIEDILLKVRKQYHNIKSITDKIPPASETNEDINDKKLSP